MAKQNSFVNHIAVVLDRSTSMGPHVSTLIKVADALIGHLAEQSRKMDQETRVTVYSFGNEVTMLIYDKDVLRLPSIKDLYQISGATALIDATMQSQQDLELIPQKYGDHSFLTYVLTDGEENRSFRHRRDELKRYLAQQPDHWTVAVLVPDEKAARTAEAFGFAKGNIQVWDASSREGLEKAVTKIQQTTDSYMALRATGVRGSKNLFDLSHISKDAVAKSGLKPLDPSMFQLIPVPPTALDQTNKKNVPVVEIARFAEKAGHRYVTGRTFYQLMKSELIQPNKAIAVVEKNTAKVFSGPQARQLVKLPDVAARINPGKNPDYDVFVQSTSLNRHLVAGQKILMLV